MSAMFDRYIAALRDSEEKDYRRRCPFVCPSCGADLSKSAEGGAYDWSEGIPNETGAFCEGCEKQMYFRLEWDHVLSSARLIDDEAEAQAEFLDDPRNWRAAEEARRPAVGEIIAKRRPEQGGEQ